MLLKGRTAPFALLVGAREMSVFRNKLYPYFYSYSYSCSSAKPSSLLSALVTRPANRGKSPASASSSISCTYNTRSSVSAMAIQQYPQQSPANDLDGFTSSPEPRSASRASSRSGRRSRRSTDEKKPQPASSRMSAFFPLGYKEAASQWVRRCNSEKRRHLHTRRHPTILTQPPSIVE